MQVQNSKTLTEVMKELTEKFKNLQEGLIITSSFLAITKSEFTTFYDLFDLHSLFPRNRMRRRNLDISSQRKLARLIQNIVKSLKFYAGEPSDLSPKFSSELCNSLNPILEDIQRLLKYASR